MIEVPPFYVQGDPDGDFFALGYVRGRYVNPSMPAFWTLYFSASPDFAPFSQLSISAADGSMLSYSRGDEELSTVEFALLRALRKEQISLSVWRLYPRASIVDAAFPGDDVRSAYWEARYRFCLLLYEEHVHTSVGPLNAIFTPEDTTPIIEHDSPDYQEIWAAVERSAARSERPGS